LKLVDVLNERITSKPKGIEAIAMTPKSLLERSGEFGRRDTSTTLAEFQGRAGLLVPQT